MTLAETETERAQIVQIRGVVGGLREQARLIVIAREDHEILRPAVQRVLRQDVGEHRHRMPAPRL